MVVHGAPLPPDAPDPRDWLLYRGYGALLAASGVVTALVSYQVSDLSALPAAADDIAAMVEQVRADPRVDPERVVLWFFSGGGLFAADWLRVPPPWLRGIALRLLAQGWPNTPARACATPSVGGASDWGSRAPDGRRRTTIVREPIGGGG